MALALGRAERGMSQLLVQRYLNELSDLRRASGTTREGVVSEAFKDLLKGYGKSNDLIFLNQYELPRQDGNRRIIDGALVYDLSVSQFMFCRHARGYINPDCVWRDGHGKARLSSLKV
jgi:hypothetical protein